ncbi:NUDIX domain-containing protein [soil metagenome]
MSSPPLATVGALVVSPAGRLLFVKTHKWKGSWGVPGGKVDYGETLQEALKREFLEETGLTLQDIRWGPVQEAVDSDEFYRPAHFILLNFIARSDSEEVTLNEEAEAYAWVEPEAADDYSLNTPTRRLLEFYRRHGFGTELLD